MSQQLINHNDDLRLLHDDGYDIEIKHEKYLLIKNVPYLNADAQIRFGTLVSVLELAGHDTVPPTDHVVFFIGEHPCNTDGSEIAQIKHSTQTQGLAEGLSVNHTFSAKPKQPEQAYRNYHHKMETYATIISTPAQVINPDVTPKIYPT